MQRRRSGAEAVKPELARKRISASDLDPNHGAVAGIRSCPIRYGFRDAYKRYFADKYLAGMLFSMALQKCSNSCSDETFRNAPNGRRQIDSTDLGDPASASRPGPSSTRGATRRTALWHGLNQEASGQADRPNLRCDDSLLLNCATPNSGDSYMGKIVPHGGLPEC